MECSSDTSDNQETHEMQSSISTHEQISARVHALQEIYTSEQTYVQRIQSLLDFYIRPLEEENHPIISNAEIAVCICLV